MTNPGRLIVRYIEQTSPLLGRQQVHDPESRNYEVRRGLDRPVSTFRHQIANPRPLPAQAIGCCTGVDQCVKGNAAGNRVQGVVLDMADAIKFYSRATQLDPWLGSYPPTDTGSSGLAACRAAKEHGIIDRYEWIFRGPDAVLTALRTRCVGVGTIWKEDMFNPDPSTLLVTPTGPDAGGHQWSLIGWNKYYNAFEGLCWWGKGFGRNGIFRIRKHHLGELLADGGDAHITFRKMT